MTGADSLVSAATTVLGWTLLHFIWQGTLLGSLLGLALLVIPRRLARVRYAAGCVTLFAMLATALVTAWRLADGSAASPLLVSGTAGIHAAMRVAAATPPSDDTPALTPVARQGGTSAKAPRPDATRLDPSAML